MSITTCGFYGPLLLVDLWIRGDYRTVKNRRFHLRDQAKTYTTSKWRAGIFIVLVRQTLGHITAFESVWAGISLSD